MRDATLTRSISPEIVVSNLTSEQRALLGFLGKYRANTRVAYETDLRQYAAWCERVDTSILNADQLRLEMYKAHLEGRGLAEATIARRFGTVLLFLHHAYAEELIGKDPTLRVSRPKVDHKKQYRTWFATVDFSLLLRESQQRPLDYAVIGLLGFVGLRVSEATGLNVEDVHREVGRVWISFIGKGGGRYDINLPLAVIQAVDRYLDGRTEGPLFLDRNGERLDRRHVQAIIDRCSRSAGITYRVTPHGLRRTLARTLQERGVELGAIQQVLRHADPRVTTTCYIGDGGGVADVARQMATSIYTSMASS